MMAPSISLVAWPERTGGFVFVRVPNERGRYLRTDPSVVNVPCSWCKAIIGEPCKNNSGTRYSASTHGDRRSEFQKRFRGQTDERRADLIEKPHFVYKGLRKQRMGEQHG